MIWLGASPLHASLAIKTHPELATGTSRSVHWLGRMGAGSSELLRVNEVA